MRLLGRILLATDFGDAAAAATKTAAALAELFGSEVVPLHVLPDMRELIGPQAMEEVHESVDRKLRGLSRRLSESQVSVATPIVAQGLPFQQILDHATDRKADVILIGAGDRGPDGRFRLGITVERVIHRSTLPVWAAIPESQPTFRSVLCAVDSSEHSRRALVHAVHLARQFDAELTVMTVIEPLQMLLPPEAKISSSAEVAYARRTHDQFQALTRGLDLQDLEITETIRNGRPADEIVRAAKELEADLIVMGSSGQNGFGSLFLGSVAKKVLQRAPCAILTMRAETLTRTDRTGLEPS